LQVKPYHATSLQRLKQSQFYGFFFFTFEINKSTSYELRFRLRYYSPQGRRSNLQRGIRFNPAAGGHFNELLLGCDEGAGRDGFAVNKIQATFFFCIFISISNYRLVFNFNFLLG